MTVTTSTRTSLRQKLVKLAYREAWVNPRWWVGFTCGKHGLELYLRGLRYYSLRLIMTQERVGKLEDAYIYQLEVSPTSSL